MFVDTDQDVTGEGLCSINGNRLKVLRDMVRSFEPLLIGLDPTMASSFYKLAWTDIGFFGHAGMSAISLTSTSAEPQRREPAVPAFQTPNIPPMRIQATELTLGMFAKVHILPATTPRSHSIPMETIPRRFAGPSREDCNCQLRWRSSVIGQPFQGSPKTQASRAHQAGAEHLGLVVGKSPGKAAGDFLATR
jgi:hypothetical protein